MIDPSPYLFLDAAARADMPAIIEYLGYTNSEYIWRFPSNKTPLMAAAGAGQLECMEFLMGHFDPTARDAEGRAALWHAAARGAASCVERLLPLTDHPTLDRARFTPLMLAAQSGSEACVALLLSSCDPDIQDSKMGLNALMHAIKGDHLDAARLLLPLTDLSQKSASGLSPIELCANHASERCLSLLWRTAAPSLLAIDPTYNSNPLASLAGRAGHSEFAERIYARIRSLTDATHLQDTLPSGRMAGTPRSGI